jgi:hypothetical protein
MGDPHGRRRRKRQAASLNSQGVSGLVRLPGRPATLLEQARERGFLGGELASRSTMRPYGFFREVPTGCRAYVVKHVIHDWDDEWAQIILVNCRRAVPADGVLLLVGWVLPEGNAPSAGKFADVVMLLMTGGKERTVEEYRRLLARVGFRLNQVVSARLEHHLGAVRLAPLGFTGSMCRAPNGTEPGFSTT